MNNILQLKGKFNSRPASAYGGDINLPKSGNDVTSEKIDRLIKEIKIVQNYWINNKIIDGALVHVHHNRIMAKSNRIKRLFKKSGYSTNSLIVGARYDVNNATKLHSHVFTYFLDMDTLSRGIQTLENVKKVADNLFNGRVTYDITNMLNADKNYIKTMDTDEFLKVIIDVCYIESISINDKYDKEIYSLNIITLYKTNIDNAKFLESININVNSFNRIDDNTFLLGKNELEMLLEKAPFLIAMGVKDFAETPIISVNNLSNDLITIDKPNNEPIVGVIDTCFDTSVYFNEWVEVERHIDKDVPIDKDDYYHGTAVSSIIVDGPTFNPNLEDNCGRFRVKHFEVATSKGYSSFDIMKSIKMIVENNRNIKVWNLSLGSAFEIEQNFISPEGAMLDKLQNDNDIIFIVAGTNKTGDVIKIGAPADSINSLVVNSVDFDNKPASYTRVGPVLSFFLKPDVAYYGGDKNKIVVCTPNGRGDTIGTSMAAPFITRKVAYLIYKMGLSRELAKAMIIDSAMGWKDKISLKYDVGYGIVPRDIEDITHSNNDEIKFVITGFVEKFENYTYELPVPKVDGTHPFLAKATLTYFPMCNRNQGVDYTQTELDISFGRIKSDGNISTINKNIQEEEGSFINEEESRKYFRKWDNVKHICDRITKRVVARKAYESGLWGISIKCKERVDGKHGIGMGYGVIVTLKEIKGKNRKEEFKNLCIARGWIVNELNVENQLTIYNELDEEITLE